jgi:hypothetical protein
MPENNSSNNQTEGCALLFWFTVLLIVIAFIFITTETRIMRMEKTLQLPDCEWHIYGKGSLYNCPDKSDVERGNN